MTIRIVYITAGSSKEARSIAKALVSEKLVACVSITSNVQSIYRWKNKIETSREHLLMIKTTARHLKALTQRVLDLHSYDVPEILVLSATSENPAYWKWLTESVTPGKS